MQLLSTLLRHKLQIEILKDRSYCFIIAFMIGSCFGVVTDHTILLSESSSSSSSSPLTQTVAYTRVYPKVSGLAA
jgi:hypothetical protein